MSARRAHALLLVALSACSLAQTQTPRPPPADPACTTSRASVGVDVAAAVLIPPLGGLLMWGLVDGEDDEDFLVGSTVVFGLLVPLVSAGIGIARTSHCREAYERRAWENHRRMGMPPIGAPAIGPAPTAPVLVPPAGVERGFCRPDATCDPGLTCASGRCVVWPPPPR